MILESCSDLIVINVIKEGHYVVYMNIQFLSTPFGNIYVTVPVASRPDCRIFSLALI